MTRCGAAAAAGAVIDGELPTTAGVLALGNLQAQIEGQEREAMAGRLDVSGQAELIELLLCGGTSWVASPTTNGPKRGPNSSRAIARLTAWPSSRAPGRGPRSIASRMR